jgi:hypothetical protein
MSSNFSELSVDTMNEQSPGICHLLKLPLEIRESIYGMLLTTPYCTTFGKGLVPWKFDFHTAILLVNKQISAEATRILYQGNDFVIVKVVGLSLWFGTVPAFDRLSDRKITSPVLQVEFTKRNASRAEVDESEGFVTTLEGVQSIIQTIWTLETRDGSIPKEWTEDSRLIINFNLKAESRYDFLSERLLRPWDQIDVKELVLAGDIKEPMRQHLKKSHKEGPFTTDVVGHLKRYNSMAEQEFKQGDYDAAQWWWEILNCYGGYTTILTRPKHLRGGGRCTTDAGIRDILKKSNYVFYRGLLILTKACLRQLKYSEAGLFAREALFYTSGTPWENRHFGRKLTPVMEAKLHLSASLAETACGEMFMDNLRKAAVRFLLQLGPCGNVADETRVKELTEDLKTTVDNELIQSKSLWRCGYKTPLLPTQQTGPEWQLGVAQRSFWEWLELPEEWEMI